MKKYSIIALFASYSNAQIYGGATIAINIPASVGINAGIRIPLN